MLKINHNNDQLDQSDCKTLRDTPRLPPFPNHTLEPQYQALHGQMTLTILVKVNQNLIRLEAL